jgi:hypothetical protein
VPIKVASFSPNEVFAVWMKYKWNNSPAKDFTVKVYSKVNIKVEDSNKVTNQLHADGKEPSEFTESEYCGMDENCTPTKLYEKSELLKFYEDKTLYYTDSEWYHRTYAT